MTPLNFIKSSFKNGKATIYLAPDFVDISKTDFPDGVLLGGETFKPEEAENFIAALQHFFTEFMADLHYYMKEEPEFLRTKHFTEPVVTVSDDYETRRWTSVYWDAHDDDVNGVRLLPYVRFVPVFLDTEAAGFSHGISVFNRFFETKAEAFDESVKFENFMNVLLAELLDNHVRV